MHSRQPLRRDDRLLLLIGVVLLTVTYTVFSARNMLIAETPDNLLSIKRLLTTSIGALAFVLVARRLRNVVSGGHLRLAASWLALVCAAAASVWIVRVGYDVLVVNESEAVLADNARWLLTWSGYFLAALVGYLSLLRKRSDRDPRQSEPAVSRNEMIAAIVTESGKWLPEERQALISALSALPDYEEADVLPGLNQSKA